MDRGNSAGVLARIAALALIPFLVSCSRLEFTRPIGHEMSNLVGSSADFSLDSWDVYVDKVTDKNTKVIIYAHGGGGLGRCERGAIRMLKNLGFDVIYFDAFAMNRLDPRWVNLNVSDASKQDIIGNVFMGAYKYALTQSHYTKIGFYGFSQGGSVVLAFLDKIQKDSRLRLILSEAPSSHGHPFPSAVNIPVYIFHGEKDNWGGRSESDLMFFRHGSIWNNGYRSSAKLSNANWAKKLQSEGQPVTAISYADAGHGFHCGMMHAVVRQMSFGSVTGFAGVAPGALQMYENDIKDITTRYFSSD